MKKNIKSIIQNELTNKVFAFWPDAEGSNKGRIEHDMRGRLVSITALMRIEERIGWLFSSIEDDYKRASVQLASREKKMQRIKDMREEVKRREKDAERIVVESSALRAELSCVKLQLRALLDASVALLLKSQPLDDCDDQDYDRAAAALWDMHNAITASKELDP
jgi:hypothetical protein